MIRTLADATRHFDRENLDEDRARPISGLKWRMFHPRAQDFRWPVGDVPPTPEVQINRLALHGAVSVHLCQTGLQSRHAFGFQLSRRTRR